MGANKIKNKDATISSKKTLQHNGKDAQKQKNSGVFVPNAGGKKTLPKNAGAFLKHRQNQKAKDTMTGGAKGSTLAASLLGLHEASQKRADDFARAEEAEPDYDEYEKMDNYGREVENNRKKFYSELRKVLAAADVVCLVLDARDPNGCRCPKIEQEVVVAGKKLVFVLNKIDLVPKHAVEAWLTYLKRYFPTIAFKAARSGTERANQAMCKATEATDGMLSSTNLVLGADNLLQLMKNYSRSGGTKMKAHITVGIVGFPNVGKSSVINSLKRHQAVGVGGTAGFTKAMQEVKLDSKVTLLDSPGVVLSGESDDPTVALRNAVRLENITDPSGVVEALVAKVPREQLLQFYRIPDFAHPHDFIVAVAKMRGKLKRGYGLDLHSSALSILSDWTSGKFRYFTMPPVQKDVQATDRLSVKTQAAPELDIDALLRGEGDLPMVMKPVPEDEDDDLMDTDEAQTQMVEVDI
jgi:nuclear GTP-binding protein